MNRKFVVYLSLVFSLGLIVGCIACYFVWSKRTTPREDAISKLNVAVEAMQQVLTDNYIQSQADMQTKMRPNPTFDAVARKFSGEEPVIKPVIPQTPIGYDREVVELLDKLYQLPTL